MDNRKIVEDIVKTQLLENIVNKITANSNDEDLKDLKQDILISLLQDDKLSGIYERHQLGFYLSRIVLNNVASSTSPFYRTYKRPRKLNEGITIALLNIPDD